MMNSLDWQTVVATPPMVIQGLTTVWPPFTLVPASSARSWSKCNHTHAIPEHLKFQIIFFIFICQIIKQCHFSLKRFHVWMTSPVKHYWLYSLTLNPLIMRGTTTSRSFSLIFWLTASSISMLSHSVTPMAYRSLSTLAQAILPWVHTLRGLVDRQCIFTVSRPFHTFH